MFTIIAWAVGSILFITWMVWLERVAKAYGRGECNVFQALTPVWVFTLTFMLYIFMTSAPTNQDVHTWADHQPTPEAIQAVEADQPTTIRTAVEVQQDRVKTDQEAKLMDRQELNKHTNEVFDDIESARCRAGLCDGEDARP